MGSAAGAETIMGRRLYVGNLPYKTTDADLSAHFSQAGTVESVRVMRDMATGRARGFAFVDMADDEAAKKAVTQFHGQPFDGRPLVVNEARPKPDGPPPFQRGGRGAGMEREHRH
jgi:RNA recognition motif-containing protein